MGNSRHALQPRLIKYLSDRPGKLVPIEDLMQQLSASKSSVQNCVSGARSTNPTIKAQLEVVVAGNMYRWKQNADTGQRLFEELAVLNNGDVLVQDENSNIYRLVKLETS